MGMIDRIGVVNWDCSLPPATFFGGYAARSLGPERFRSRMPYYAQRLAPDRIAFPERTLAEYETEMRYAIGAGIDYFAYCWYDRETHAEHLVEDAGVVRADEHVAELVRARLLHQQSPLRGKLHFCAILLASHPYSDREVRALASAMRDPGYERIDGRPLVWFFTGEWGKLLARLRCFCREEGVPDPYAVLMRASGEVTAEEAARVQAICAYSCAAKGIRRPSEFFAAVIAANEKRLRSGLPVVPHFAMGWDPEPRIVNPVPWCGYPAGPYAPMGTREELLAGAREFKEWIARNRERCVPGHLLTFAWNEFEEGAWICPTLGRDGGADFSLRNAFAEAVALWRHN